MDENKCTQFGPRKEKTYLEQNFIGQYVILFPRGGSTQFCGFLSEIRDGWVYLNPFQAGHFTENGLVREIINKPMAMRLEDIQSIEPTTRESLDAFCAYMNKEEAKKKNEDSKSDK